MKKILLVFTFFYFGAITCAIPFNINPGFQKELPGSAKIKLLSGNVSDTRIQIKLDGFNEFAVNTPRGLALIISSPEGVQICEKGMPDLGKLFENIVIPDLAQMETRVIRTNFQEFNDVDIAPSKGHFTREFQPHNVPFEYSDVYEKDAFWPGRLVQLEDPFIIRDFRGQTITFFPFQYNPVLRILRVYTEIEIEVFPTGLAGRTPLIRKHDQITVEPEFGKIYDNFFLNMNVMKDVYPLLEGEEGSLLIIAYDDFSEPMQPFVNWKRTIGRTTELVPISEVGHTPQDIKAYVHNYYHGNENFTYLLLVGDYPQVPSAIINNNHSDNAYAFILGDDSYNDIFVGRFSAETVEEVQTQVQRIIEYERDISETDTWLSRGSGIARNEGTGIGHNGENDYEHMDFIRDTLLNFTYDLVYRRYDGDVPGVPNANAAQISSDINHGVGIVNYCNHGSTNGWFVANYNIINVNQLTNAGKLPFIWSVACLNGNFAHQLCFAEAWMRATHSTTGQPTGAIGILASTISQAWTPPMTGQDEMVALLTEQSIFGHQAIKRTFGGITTNGSMAMIPPYGQEGAKTHETWLLFGDPTLMVRTAAPTSFDLTYTPVIFLGDTTFSVSVTHAEGATVALTYFNQEIQEVEIIGKAFIEEGSATIIFNEPVNEPRHLSFAITGFNKVTYLNERIPVIEPEGPYVFVHHFAINDQEGNNNGIVDYGETILLDMTLKNAGFEKANNVQALLTTDNQYINITQNLMNWGDIPENDTSNVISAFSFEVSEQIPDKHKVNFNLSITDASGNEWTSNFHIFVFAPHFIIDAYQLDDSWGGDGNGFLDPGESATITVRYNNIGGASALAPLFEMKVSNPYIIVSQDVFEAEIIPTESSIDVTFVLEAHQSTPIASPVNLVFSALDGRYFESEQTLYISQLPEQSIGHGIDESGNYPFFNHLNANRTQMLYLSLEMGLNEKVITHIGFDITQASTQNNILPNFEIRMKAVSQHQLSGFVNTSSNDVVFSEPSYQMPETIGWHIWELDHPYIFDGQNNLLVEIVWGLLSEPTATYYKVASTQQAFDLVAYGTSENSAVPGFDEISKIRPNIWLAFNIIDNTQFHQVSFKVRNNAGEGIPNGLIKVGSHTMPVDLYGETNLRLASGNYSFMAEAEGYSDYYGEFSINNQDIEVHVVLSETFTISADLKLQTLKVFPNPAKDILNILNPNGMQVQLSLINMLGKTLFYETNANSNVTLNLSGLPSGLYFLRIETAESSQVKKIIKF
jgi:hypothetical protein